MRQCTLVTGVIGSFERDPYVKGLSEILIDDKDILNRLFAEVQRATHEL